MTENEIDGEQPLPALLGAWADAIARHEPAEVAALFTEDALFQGFDPEPGSGRDVVEAYYGKQPLGLTAEWELLRVRRLSADTEIGYARVLFRRPDAEVPTYLTVVATRTADGWQLSHYHVSKQLGV